MQKMIQTEIWTIIKTNEGCAVLLRPLKKNVAVPIFVGQLEIQSILIGKEELSLPRPLTHDLFLRLLDKLNLVLEKVEIHDLIDSTFHARLVFYGGNYTEENPLTLDSRPSDALGLAVRRKCPIMISSAIVQDTGISLEIFTNALDTGEIEARISKSSPQENKRQILMKQLNEAVENEEYEKAAQIRDLLKEM